MSTAERTGGDRPRIALLSGHARRIRDKLIDTIRRRTRRRLRAHELAQLDDRMLRDIGLTRSEVRAAALGVLRLREPCPVIPSGALRRTDPANVVRLKHRAIAVRVDQATSAPLVKHAARL